MKWQNAVIIVLLCGCALSSAAEQPAPQLQPVVTYMLANGKPIGSIAANAAVPLGLNRTGADVPVTYKGFKGTGDSRILHWRCDVLVDGSGIVFSTMLDSTGRKTFFWADLSGRWIRAITATDTSNIRTVAPTEYNLKLFEAEKAWWLTLATTGEKKGRSLTENTAPQ